MLKKFYFYLLSAFALCFLPFLAHAQTYPVTISTQLTQPSPIYLSNYANVTTLNSPIKVQLILNDLTIMNRQVRLKCYFSGSGASFVSKDYVIGTQPLYLEGGFPTQLTNVELAPYFEFNNIQGINPNQYAQPLPEGIYTISFEVYDFATNKKLSKKSSVTTIIFQNEPPFLNLPANKAGIMEQSIQNIIFSWTPRSINVSNVEYEFSLVEIWNSNTPIQNAFAYSPPLYTTTTRNTTVQYSIAEPQLIPGKTYAWRVKAKALLGAEEIGVFKNNGYSETCSFKYLTFCKSPQAITTTDVSQEQAKVTWSGAVDNYDYQVNYREKNADSKWYKLVTPREYVLISNLKPKTTYEYTVGAACDLGEYTHSNVQEFTTLTQDEIAFTGCGIKPDPTALSNKTPLPALFPNDVVTAGDFPIVVLKSTGSNGTFSGEGYVTLPFLAKFRELIDAAAALAGSDDKGDSKANIGKYTRIRITFNNIGVNSDFKLISGEIIASYDLKGWGANMLDGDKLVDEIGKIINSIEDLYTKLDKLEEQKADGTITTADYKKAWAETLNDIQKGNDQFKELINKSDLPDSLNKEVSQLTPPLPESASNDNSAVKVNSKAQEKAYLEKINTLAKVAEAYEGKGIPPSEVKNISFIDDKEVTITMLNEIRYNCTVTDALGVKIGMTKVQKGGESYLFCKANRGTYYYYQGKHYWYIDKKWYLEDLCNQKYCIKLCTEVNKDGTGTYAEINLNYGDPLVVKTINFVNKTCLIDIPLLIIGGASTEIPVVLFNVISSITIDVLSANEVLSDREALISQVVVILVSHNLSSVSEAPKLAERLVDKIKNGWKLSGKSKEELIVEVEKALGKSGKMNRESWNGFNKIFKATADEITEATTKIKNYRTINNLKGGNFGYLDGTVNDVIVDSKLWRSVSSDVAENEIHIFDAIKVQGSSGSEWLRITDSEYRMLNKLANDLGAVKIGKYPNIKGELKIISENPYCASCTGIIQQFNEMFPNIKLILIDGAK